MPGSPGLTTIRAGTATPYVSSFLLSAAAGDQVLPPLVMAWAGLGTGAAVLAVAGWTGRCISPPAPPTSSYCTATSAGSCRCWNWRWSRR